MFRARRVASDMGIQGAAGTVCLETLLRQSFMEPFLVGCLWAAAAARATGIVLPRWYKGSSLQRAIVNTAVAHNIYRMWLALCDQLRGDGCRSIESENPEIHRETTGSLKSPDDDVMDGKQHSRARDKDPVVLTKASFATLGRDQQMSCEERNS